MPFRWDQECFAKSMARSLYCVLCPNTCSIHFMRSLLLLCDKATLRNRVQVHQSLRPVFVRNGRLRQLFQDCSSRRCVKYLEC